MVDTAGLKTRTDLLALVEADTQLRKVASTFGGEYAGPCPFCGGHDRFRVQPERGLWWCRQCAGEHWQDAIAYIRRRNGVSFAEACAVLGQPAHSSPPRRGPTRGRSHLTEVEPEPTAEWREAAQQLVERCATTLWEPEAEGPRRWLAARGLCEETLRRWRVGYSPLSQVVAGLRVARGIVLPWFDNDVLWQVKVRLPVKSGDKYSSVRGGHPFLYGVGQLRGGARVAALCEGEFDAMLLDQEAGDLVAVATLGSAQRMLGMRGLSALLPYSRILLAYDTDAEGIAGAQRLEGISTRMRRIDLPAGKDITDFWRQGGHLRDWIRFELARLAPPPALDTPSKLSQTSESPTPVKWIPPADPDEAYTAAGEQVTAILAEMTAAYERGDLAERSRLLRDVFTPAAAAYSAARDRWQTERGGGYGAS